MQDTAQLCHESDLDVKTLTLSSIKDRCIDDGDGCLLWTGSMSGSKPTARHNGSNCNVRHLFWNLTHPTKQLGPQQILRITCHDKRCLIHMSRTTRAGLMQRTATLLRGNVSAIAARTAARRRRSPLTAEIVDQIRQDQRTVDQIAAHYGICRRTTQRIRKMETWAPLAGSSVFRIGAAA